MRERVILSNLLKLDAIHINRVRDKWLPAANLQHGHLTCDRIVSPSRREVTAASCKRRRSAERDGAINTLRFYEHNGHEAFRTTGR
jgi:hypothetical protein